MYSGHMSVTSCSQGKSDMSGFMLSGTSRSWINQGMYVVTEKSGT